MYVVLRQLIHPYLKTTSLYSSVYQMTKAYAAETSCVILNLCFMTIQLESYAPLIQEYVMYEYTQSKHNTGNA